MMSDATTFGRLTQVDLRAAWTREDTHFTPWLAEPDNLALLGRTIGIELELQGQEQSVGPFRADILCKNLDRDSLVLIENQIERTDHTHLGQVITYAAGLDAVTIVWIAKRFTEEHRAALDWINEISHEEIRFFGLEVELWKIGDSPIAPKFNIVARPNDWSKVVRDTQSGASPEHRALRYKFWRGFLDHLDEANSPLNTNRTPSREHWMSWGVGRTNFRLVGSVGFRDKWCGVQLDITGEDGLELFRALEAERDAIERELGFEVVWDPATYSRKTSYIYWRREGVDPSDEGQWSGIHSWMRKNLESMRDVFGDRVLTISPSPNREQVPS